MERLSPEESRRHCQRMAAGVSLSACGRGGLQPLKATVPFQLQRRRGGDGGRAASVPCAAAAATEKACRNRPPRVRRTSSLDTVLGSYLLKDPSSGALETPVLETKGKENGNSSPVLAFALSPRPNHTYVFKREPPEGCEKIRAYEEAAPLDLDQAFLPSCPDKNKVHFNPTGSAFCQFSLVKPLIPSVDFLFTDFTSSPSPAPPGTCSRQPTSKVPLLALRKDSRGDNFSKAPQSPPLESWKQNQAEDTILFHSSLAV
ncbi:UNVERIFIED_CONTAM: hypothetical protein K2H54_071456 [Gekko kuhli]